MSHSIPSQTHCLSEKWNIISVWETTMCTGTTRQGGNTIRVCVYWTLVGDCNMGKKKQKNVSVSYLQFPPSHKEDQSTRSTIFLLVQGWWGGIKALSWWIRLTNINVAVRGSVEARERMAPLVWILCGFRIYSKAGYGLMVDDWLLCLCMVLLLLFIMTNKQPCIFSMNVT